MQEITGAAEKIIDQLKQTSERLQTQVEFKCRVCHDTRFVEYGGRFVQCEACVKQLAECVQCEAYLKHLAECKKQGGFFS